MTGYTGAGVPRGHGFENIAGFNPEYLIWGLATPEKCFLCQHIPGTLCARHGEDQRKYEHYQAAMRTEEQRRPRHNIRRQAVGVVDSEASDEENDNVENDQ